MEDYRRVLIAKSILESRLAQAEAQVQALTAQTQGLLYAEQVREEEEMKRIDDLRMGVLQRIEGRYRNTSSD